MSIKYTFNDNPDRVAFLEPGEYKANVIGFEFGMTKNGDSKLDLKLDIEGKCTVYDTTAFTESAGWKFDSVLKCFAPNKEGGEVPPKGEQLEINEEFMNKNILGATGWVSLFIDTWNDRQRSKVQNFISAATKPLDEVKRDTESDNPDW